MSFFVFQALLKLPAKVDAYQKANLSDPPTASPTDPPLIPDGHYLDFSRTGIPWVDRALDIATVGALVLVVICAVGFIAWVRWVKPALTHLQATAEKAAKGAEKAATDAAVTREQTENSHTGAPNPNLRDDIDAKHNQTHEELANLAKMMARMEHAQARTDKELSRINDTLLDDREATREVGKKLDAHIEQKLGFEERITVVEAKLDSHREVTEAP